MKNNTATKLKVHNAMPPRIYKLPKLHKLFLACIQSPLENLSKFSKNILQNIINKNNL